MIGKTYLERGRPVTVLIKWAPWTAKRNVLIRREDGTLTVRPFRGLRVPRLKLLDSKGREYHDHLTAALALQADETLTFTYNVYDKTGEIREFLERRVLPCQDDLRRRREVLHG